MSKNPAVIRVEGLKKAYYNDGVPTHVLHGIDFEIPKGEFVAIMGPSGSGKSTLMQILGFLDTLTGGKYLFEGRDVSKMEDDELAAMRGEKVGFIFQSFNLLPKTTVLENVMLPLLYSDVPLRDREKLAMEAIDIVGLRHRVKNLSNQLSGGERQRVAIARALVRKPSVIFADEPTGNLDSKNGQAVMDTLLELNLKKGHTIILVTHETDTAAYAERILTLRDGLLVSDRRLDGERHKLGERELKK
ncbi:ABC transporter ATP-binding protein [Candidatus Uhrbacteria bacterium]|jgi:putative ABC transport system ATP-binding protein|nr:MAG: ABC transporter ATP-binding protein [Candidatus Uhrbacteria bacterium]